MKLNKAFFINGVVVPKKNAKKLLDKYNTKKLKTQKTEKEVYIYE